MWQETEDDLGFPVSYVAPAAKVPSVKRPSRTKKPVPVPGNPKNKFDHRLSDVRAPALTDPCWVGWTAPISKYLSEPRTWPQLEAWRKTSGVSSALLRHGLAWLEEMGHARSYSQKDVIYWASNITDCSV
jgi:hypothetical protein